MKPVSRSVRQNRTMVASEVWQRTASVAMVDRITSSGSWSTTSATRRIDGG